MDKARKDLKLYS